MTGESRLVALIADAPRGPKRDGLFALWLVLRAATGVMPPHPISPRNHRRRLQAVEARLGGLALPAPLKRALLAARVHLEPATEEAATVALAQLIAPTRDVLGPEAAAAVALAARQPHVAL